MATSEKTAELETESLELNTKFINKWRGAKKYGYYFFALIALLSIFFWIFFFKLPLWLLILFCIMSLLFFWCGYSELNKYRFPFNIGQCKTMTLHLDRITFEGETLFTILFSEIVSCQILKTPSLSNIEPEFILLLIIKTKTETYKLPDSAYISRRDAQQLFVRIKQEIDFISQKSTGNKAETEGKP